MEAVQSSDAITFRVTFKGESETFRLPPQAHLDELSMLLYSSFGAVPSTQKLLPRKNVKSSSSDPDLSPASPNIHPRTAANSKSAGLLKLTEDGVAELSLLQAGIYQGSTFNLLASTDADLTYVASLRDDPLLRGLEEEEELERRRRDRGSGPSKAPVAPLGGVGFGDFRTLKAGDVGLASLNPPPEEALRIMYSLATDIGIVTVMKRYKWRVGIMTEMPPVGKVGISPRCVLGFNVNRGQEISLRLRTDDLKGFRKYEVIRSTLLHELTHMVFDEHDNDFKALNSKLVKEAQVSAHRIEGSHFSGGSSHVPGSASVPQPQVHTLGGGDATPADPRTAAAIAALSRHAAGHTHETEEQGWENSWETHAAEQGSALEDDGRAPGSWVNPGASSDAGACELAEKMQVVAAEESAELIAGADQTATTDTSPPGSPPSGCECHHHAATPMAVDQGVDGDIAPVQIQSLEHVEEGPHCQDPTGQVPEAALSGEGGAEEEPLELPEDVSAAASSAKDAQRRIKVALERLEQEVQLSGCEVAAKALAIVRTILRNVLQHPADQRYRTIRKANRKVQEVLGRFPSALELLRVAGFKDGDGGEGEVLHCRTPDPGLLWLACAMLDESGILPSAA